MNMINTRKRNHSKVNRQWSKDAQTLATYNGMDSTTWKLGIISEFDHEPLKSQIHELAKRSDCPNPFFNVPFLSASVTNLAKEHVQFLFLSETIGEHETLKMFAPVIETKYGLFRKPVLKIWTNLYAPLGVPLIDAKDDFSLHALIQCLKVATHETATALLLEFVPEQSQFLKQLHISTNLATILHRLAYSTRAMLKPGMPANYLETRLSGKRKQRLNKGMKDLKALGKVRIEKTTSPQKISKLLDEFLMLEEQGWKGKRGTSLKAQKTTAALAREAVLAMNAQKRCTIYTMRLDKKAIASLILFSDNGYYFPWKITHDECHAKCSPGNNLLAHVNQELYATNGFKGVDSLAADNNYTARTFWPDEQGLYSMVIGLGKNATHDASMLANEIHIKKRLKGMLRYGLGWIT